MATSVERKIEVLKKLNKVGIKTAVFISPIMPGITNWKRIIDLTRKYTDEFWFENLNLYPSIKGDILRFYNENGIEYDERNYRTEYLANLEKEIKAYCPDLKISIYFNHKSSREY